MTVKTLDPILDALGRLPAIPAALRKLRDAVADDSIPTETAAAIIEADRALAERFLDLATEPFFGTVTPCESIADALTVLGREKTARIVGAIGIGEQLRPHDDDERAFFDETWRHGILTARRAAALAIHVLGERDGGVLDVRALDRLYVAALLHDVGRMVLRRIAREAIVDVATEAALTGVATWEVERSLLGFTHGEAGAALCAEWGFSPRLARAVRDHHAVATETDDLRDFIQLADDDQEPPDDVARRHGLDAKRLEQIFADSKAG